MNSIEKLRKFIDDWLTQGGRPFSEGMAIADEIEHSYMPLPVDADGEPLHVGDAVYYEYAGNKSSARETVVWIAVSESETHIETNHNSYSRPEALRHFKLDPLNELLRKFGECYSNGGLDDGDIGGFADEIRELMEEGGDE